MVVEYHSMSVVKAGNITKGMYLDFKSQPYMVTKTTFVSPGKGSAFMRCRLKSVKTGQTVEFTYKSNEMVEELDVQTQRMQYLYHDADEVVFMNERTFEQASAPTKLLEDKLDLLTSAVEVYVLFYEDKAIGASLPTKIKLKVVKADHAVAGDTVGQAKKEVELETGLRVMAPLFVKVGDILIIDTDSKQYVSRD